MGTGEWGIWQYWNPICPGKHETDVLNLDFVTAFVLDSYFRSLLCKAVLTADVTSLLLCFCTNAPLSG